MMKKLILVIFFIGNFSVVICQTNGKKIQSIEGYYFFGLSYNSEKKYYSYDDNFFLDKTGKRYSIIQLNHKGALLDCSSKAIQQKVEQEIKENPVDFWTFNITRKKDSLQIDSNVETWTGDCFFQDRNGKIFIGMKIKSKAYVFNKICTKYKSNLKIQSICNTVLKPPFIVFTTGISKESIKKVDLPKVKLEKAAINEITFIPCY